MHRDTVARYLRRLADERRAVAAEWDRKIQECRWASDWAAQEREWAIRIDRLAEAAECGPWPRPNGRTCAFSASTGRIQKRAAARCVTGLTAVFP
jgi:hypothetical protein